MLPVRSARRTLVQLTGTVVPAAIQVSMLSSGSPITPTSHGIHISNAAIRESTSEGDVAGRFTSEEEDGSFEVAAQGGLLNQSKMRL